MHLRRKIVRGTHHGDLIRGARDRGEPALGRPIADGGIDRQTHDGIGAGKQAEFELVAFHQPSTALRRAARARMRVESSMGSGEDSGVISKGISVQASATASHPSYLSSRLTSVK